MNLNPVTQLDRATSKLADRNLNALRRGLGRRNFIGIGVGFVVYFVAVFAAPPTAPVHVIVTGLLTGIGLLALCGLYQHNAYRVGRRDGRNEMIFSLGEARRRGMTTLDWMQGEMVRDAYPHCALTDDDGHVVGIMSVDDGLRLLKDDDADEG